MHHLTNGVSYYRLTQTDYDGNSTNLGIRPINIEASNTQMSIVPNPAQNNVSLLFYSSSANQNTVVSIFDCTGRMISSRSVTSINGMNRITTDISGYSAGIYLVTINTSEKQYTGKLAIK